MIDQVVLMETILHLHATHVLFRVKHVQTLLQIVHPVLNLILVELQVISPNCKTIHASSHVLVILM